MLNTNKPHSLTQEEIAEWESKDKHGRKLMAWEYDTDEPGESVVFFVCAPHVDLMHAVSDVAPKSSKKATEMLLNACIVAGPVAHLQRDMSMYLGIGEDITDLVKVKKRK